MPIASTPIGRICRHRRCVARDTATTTPGPAAVVKKPPAIVTMTAIGTGHRRRNAIRTRQTMPTTRSPIAQSGLASQVACQAPIMTAVLIVIAAR